MKSFFVWLGIIGILAYVVLNYQKSQYHYYNNARLLSLGIHQSYASGSDSPDIEFMRDRAFKVSESNGIVLEYGKLIKKATPNINDDDLASFTIYLPFKTLKSGDSIDFSPTRGALLFYAGGLYRKPCYGYSSNGSVDVKHAGEIKITARVHFTVDLTRYDGADCGTVSFDEEVEFKQASNSEYWRPKSFYE